jgi:hypothetical protein
MKPPGTSQSTWHTLFTPARRAALLNAAVLLLAALVGYLGYSFVERTVIRPPVESMPDRSEHGRPIQVAVFNGSGSAGIAAEYTGYLRSRGYDVVEVRNYRTDGLQRSLVVDRVGERSNAEKVAHALGIADEQILQQISKEDFVDVSVIVGRDYRSLKPSQ